MEEDNQEGAYPSWKVGPQKKKEKRKEKKEASTRAMTHQIIKKNDK
jgi:hypothetical protein